MSKSIKIPEIGQAPIRLKINNTEYTFTPGETATVPDDVAELLAQITGSKPMPAADGYRGRAATIGDVEDMIAAAGGGGEGTLVATLTITDNEGTLSATCDKSVKEIAEAVMAKKGVRIYAPAEESTVSGIQPIVITAAALMDGIYVFIGATFDLGPAGSESADKIKGYKIQGTSSDNDGVDTWRVDEYEVKSATT